MHHCLHGSIHRPINYDPTATGIVLVLDFRFYRADRRGAIQLQPPKVGLAWFCLYGDSSIYIFYKDRILSYSSTSSAQY